MTDTTIPTHPVSPSPGTPGEGRGEGLTSVEGVQNQKDPHPNPLPEYRERGQEGASSLSANTVSSLLDNARTAQQRWAQTSLRQRLKLLRAWRHLIAAHATELAQAIDRPGRTLRETLVAEVLPVCQAIRFLERRAPRILRTTSAPPGGLPFVGSGRVTLIRDPAGVVLVIGPGNYPLFLPGVQLAQALCAGNAVLLKPAPNCAAPVQLLCRLAEQAGLPGGLITLLDEQNLQLIGALLQQGVDHVLLTGSGRTGAAVLNHLAEAAREKGVVTPITLELSGCDAVFIQRDADLSLAAKGLAFALTFNGGETCVAPRRIFVSPAQRIELQTRLIEALRDAPSTPLPAHVTGWVHSALQAGATVVYPAREETDAARGPTVLAEVTPDMLVARQDMMAPVMSLLEADTDDAALKLYEQCPYALGAAVFGSARSAAGLARRINAGVVTINDLVAPHGDPRVPLAPRRCSGYGVSRGAAGLLELTRLKAITRPASSRRLHLRPAQPGDSALFSAWIELAHGAGGIRNRVNTLRNLWRRVRQHGREATD